MSGFTDDLIETANSNNADVAKKEAQEQMREDFRQANASSALEGLVAGPELLAMQEEIIAGRLSTEDAIAVIRAKYSEPQ